MREEAAGKDLGRADGEPQGGGAPPHTGEPVCLELPGPQEQALRGRWDLGSSQLCGWGGLAQPGVPVGPVWGLGLRQGHLCPALARTPAEAPRPSSPGQVKACGSASGAKSLSCVFTASPRGVGQLVVRPWGPQRSREPSQKSKHEREPTGHATLAGVAAPDSTPVPARTPPCAVLGAPTVPQRAKPRPGGERTRSGLSRGLGQEPRHVHRTRQPVCSNTYTLAPL